MIIKEMSLIMNHDLNQKELISLIYDHNRIQNDPEFSLFQIIVLFSSLSIKELIQ